MARVLIVDDSEPAREMLAASLKREGVEVLSAVDGLDALALLDKCQLPDLIVSDIQMPRMDGRQFIKALKANPIYKKIPVIVLSGEPDLDDLKDKAVAIFHRPVEVKRVLWEILRAIGLIQI